MTSDKHTLAMDIECYQNFFLVALKSLQTGSFRAYRTPDLNTALIKTVLRDYRIVTFNGDNYDIPMLALALRGASTAELKAASDYIITEGAKSWQVYRKFDLEAPKVDHIDLIEVAPGDGSLKLYGGRLHSRRLQDLPIEPDALITPEQAEELTRYCENDLDTTIDLYRSLEDKIALRAAMSEQYGIDLRSKSDAQIAEAVITRMVAKETGQKPSRPSIRPGTVYRYQAPAYLQFQTEQMRLMLLEVAESQFVIDEKGSPIEPPALKGRVVRIGKSDYRMGIGGLHSSEEKSVHLASNGFTLMDVDVASFYPSIILQCGLFPEHLGAVFLKVYSEIVDSRLAAKKEQKRLSQRITELKKELCDATAKTQVSQAR